MGLVWSGGRHQALPAQQYQRGDQRQPECVVVDRVQVRPERRHNAEEAARHLCDAEAEKIAQLRQDDQRGNAVGKADHHRHRNEADQRAEPEQPHQEQHDAGHHGGDQQVGNAVAFDNAVDDHDEGAGRTADLDAAAAEQRDQEAGHDGGDQSGARWQAAGNGKGQRHRQCHQADGDAGRGVVYQTLAVVAAQRAQDAGPEDQDRGRQLHGGTQSSGVRAVSGCACPAVRPGRAPARRCRAGRPRQHGWRPAPCLR